MTTPLQKAVIDRTTLEMKIDIIERKVASHAAIPLSSGSVDLFIKKTEAAVTALNEIHLRIAHLAPPDIDDHLIVFVAWNERLDDAATALHDIKLEAAAAAVIAAPPVPLPPPRHHHLKLPEIKLPAFDGKYEDWPSFEDLFTATIDKNTSLSDAQKLQYLKTCTTGEASNLIKSFTVTDCNYAEAWTLLSTRFNNKREIIYSLCKKILFQQHLKNESVLSLQQLLNTTMECVRSLRVLGRPVDTWDDLLVVTIVEKMDPDTKSEWAKSLSGTAATKLKELEEFLERHIRSLIAKGSMTNKVNLSSSSAGNSSSRNNHQQPRSYARSHFAGAPQCSLCKAPHYLFQCTKLLEMQPSMRMTAVRKTAACTNCLREGHNFKNCSSKHTCRVCNRKHHSLLHAPASQATTNGNGNPSNGQAIPPQQHVNTNTASSVQSSSSQVLLKTAIVSVKNKFGRNQPCRVLLDDGSEASFITETCANSLGLQRQGTNISITGISANEAAHVKWKATASLHSCVENAAVDVELLLLPKVTGTLPRVEVDSTHWSHLSTLQLADPMYYRPGDVDILLGADVVASIMREGRIEGPVNAPIAQNTIFGWVLSGRVSTLQQQTIRSNYATCRLEELVDKFWKIEDLPNRKPLTKEESACEAHFGRTFTRKPDGRYVVRLPFRNPHSNISIGETRVLAEHRLFQLEKRLARNPDHHLEYKKFMRQYIQMGHMELAPPLTSTANVYYIPHHFVLKEDSSTTKLRVVFDASMKSKQGISLNDVLMVGPTVQDDLFTLLVRWRCFLIALKGDIEKMFRQFEVHPDDRDFQRILWRDEITQQIVEYILNTVTYGTGPAPYLSTRCLEQLAKDEAERFPKAAKVINSDLYVDDLLSGESSTSTAISLTKEIIELVKAGAMSIRKWCSNDPEVMESIPEELRETGASLTFDEDAAIKALGISWQPATDNFTFYTKTKPFISTKRELLSEISKTFDPLGWLSPFTISAKILFQDLWQVSKDWDEPINQHFQSRWSEYQQQLTELSSLQIPRCITYAGVIEQQLFGFSDASEKAYAAAVYLRSVLPNGDIRCQLIAARTRVSPLSFTSIPRLELCGTVLLSELIDSVTTALPFKCSIYCYTDSMIVLKWLSSSSRRWKTYVANRVAAVQEVVPSELWRHVRSQDNPADLPSRGIPSSELISSSLWWHGPAWLCTDSFPVSCDQLNTEAVVEEEKNTLLVHVATASKEPSWSSSYISRFSSLRKLVNSTAILQLFIKYLQEKRKPIQVKFISPILKSQATASLILLVQKEAFPQEMQQLRSKQEVKPNSKLISLTPFLDAQGIIRSAGRLQNAPVPDDVKHPVILPKHHYFSGLIINDAHIRHFHSGVSLTHAAIRQGYWILGAKDIIRHHVRKCIKCRRVKATTMSQLMGQLPVNRVTAHRPFLHSGVDFAGPFNIKMRRGRGAASDKCYFAIFVCLSTKAIHLEAVTSLTTDGFIACFRRFTSRRGICSHMYCDCGTNFVGANKELREDLKKIELSSQQQLSHLGTTFHFNPPAAPHQGGLWEAGVKSVKFHMKRVVGSSNLTFEQFQTLLCNIEACLNSRPLCPLSDDPQDFGALTPGHFLIGEPLTAVPALDLTDVNPNRLSYWQEVQQRSQHFWTRWQSEYITTLQQRHKWTRKGANPTVGDLVVVREDNQPPTQWKLGRIIAVSPGADGLVRKAVVRVVINHRSNPVKYGELTRPITKLSPLINSNEMQ